MNPYMSHPVGAAPNLISRPEAFLLSLLLALAVWSILAEVIRRGMKAHPIVPGQFWLRMLGGLLIVFLVAIVSFGVLFLRPEDGRIFAWYWAFCSAVLFGLLLLARQDLAYSRRALLAECDRVRRKSISDMQSIAEKRAEITTTPGDSIH